MLVEDACEALGARYKGRPLGSHGHLATWAFYPNKQMTTGEGGAVTTGSAEEHELLVSLRNQGRLETSSWLQHGRLGFNYRLDDISAALGIGQLEKLDRILASRAEVAARYGELLAGVDVELPLADDADHERSWFVYVVKLPAGVDRDGVIGALGAEGVACAPYLPSIHLQSYMRERYGFAEGMFPVSEDASARTMAIPFHARLEREDQERVVEALRAALEPPSGGLSRAVLAPRDNRAVADGAPRMIFLGFGKYVRADKIYALEPLGPGLARPRRTHARVGRGDRRADRRVAHGARDRRRDGREPGGRDGGDPRRRARPGPPRG